MSIRPSVQNGGVEADTQAVDDALGANLADSLVTGSLPFYAGMPTAGPLLLEIHSKPTEAQERRRLARAYVEAVRAISVVREVWLLQHRHHGVVTVVTAHANLDEELRMEAVFRSIFRLGADAPDSLLDVYAESEGVPPNARSGERLI
jgi:hypothetical protein